MTLVPISLSQGSARNVWEGSVQIRAVPRTEAACYAFHGLALKAALAIQAAVPDFGASKQFKEDEIIGATWVWSEKDEDVILSIVARSGDAFRPYLAVIV